MNKTCFQKSIMTQDHTDKISLVLRFHAGLSSHQYIIDSWIKTREKRLNWLARNQVNLRADLHEGKQLTKFNL